MLKIPFTYQADVILKGKRKNRMVIVYDSFIYEPDQLKTAPECLATCENEYQNGLSSSYFDINNQLFKSFSESELYIQRTQDKNKMIDAEYWNRNVDQFIQGINEKGGVVQFDGNYANIPKLPINNMPFMNIISPSSFMSKELYVGHDQFEDTQKKVLSDNREAMKNLAIAKLKKSGLSVHNGTLYYNAEKHLMYLRVNRSTEPEVQLANGTLPFEPVVPFFCENIMKELLKDGVFQKNYHVDIKNQQRLNELYPDNLIEQTGRCLLTDINKSLLNVNHKSSDLQLARDLLRNADLTKLDENEVIMITEQLNNYLSDKITQSDEGILKNRNFQDAMSQLKTLTSYIDIVKEQYENKKSPSFRS